MADSKTTDADRMVEYMRRHSPPREVYLAKLGGYFLTYPGAAKPRPRVSLNIIHEALRRGLIRVKYPGLECWGGK